MELERLYNNINSLDVVKLAIEIFENDLAEFIADLNRKQMADKGQRSDGSKLTPDYSGFTELMKRPKSGTAGITSHVTLYDTGELHKSIFAQVVGNEIVLDSKDWKVFDLTDKYGDFLGLTPESITELQNKFMPIFIQKLNNVILQ